MRGASDRLSIKVTMATRCDRPCRCHPLAKREAPGDLTGMCRWVVCEQMDLAGLPEWTDGQSQEEAARATVGWFLKVPPEREGPKSGPPELCPNCVENPGQSRSPYCGAQCKNESAFVRQFRAAAQSGDLADPDRQIALGQKLWHLIGGGYPLRVSLVSRLDMERFLAKSGGLCASCGNPAVTFDHLGSG